MGLGDGRDAEGPTTIEGGGIEEEEMGLALIRAGYHVSDFLFSFLFHRVELDKKCTRVDL